MELPGTQLANKVLAQLGLEDKRYGARTHASKAARLHKLFIMCSVEEAQCICKELQNGGAYSATFKHAHNEETGVSIVTQVNYKMPLAA